MVTSDNIISTLSRQSKDSVVSVPAFIWYPHYLNVFYKICYVYCNDGNVFQSTWTTLKTLEEDSAVSGEKNNPLKRSFSELEFVHQIQFHTSLRFRLQWLDRQNSQVTTLLELYYVGSWELKNRFFESFFKRVVNWDLFFKESIP